MTGPVRAVALAVALSLALAGCTTAVDRSPPPSSTESPVLAADQAFTVDGRTASLHVPASYRDGRAVPLVVGLHGYTATGASQEAYLRIGGESDRRGFLYVSPDGTKDSDGYQFWNSGGACCNLYGSTVDDSGYLSRLITAIEAKYTVDTGHVFLIGHSNGGFMAYRMACEHADQVTAVVSFSGAMTSVPCRPGEPVSVLDIHGTADDTIRYEGGQLTAGQLIAAPYPSAAASLAEWVRLDGCDTARMDTGAPPLDLVADLPGPETNVTRYPACRAGVNVQAWTMVGGGHQPRLSTEFVPLVFDYLLTQART